MKTVYAFNIDTGVLLSTIRTSDEDAARLLGMPGYTDDPIPDGLAGPRLWPVRGATGWVAADDHRGEVWHNPETSEEAVILEIGAAPPPGWVYGQAPEPQVAQASDQALGRSTDI